MSNNSEEQITQNVLDSMAHTLDPRLKQVMSSLISHIHAFIREVELTQEEDEDGLYEQQDPEQPEMNLRGKLLFPAVSVLTHPLGLLG